MSLIDFFRTPCVVRVKTQTPDGKLFRVVSDQEDTATPDCAMFQFKQVTAVEWGET